MPTFTFTWSDLALGGIAAGLIGTVLFVGASQRSAPATNQPIGGSISDSKKKKQKAKTAPTHALPPPAPASDADSSASVTDAPKISVASVTPETAPPDSGSSSDRQGKEKEKEKSKSVGQQRPLAERMKKKPPKTAGDDMVDPEVQAPVTMARVMRIVEDPPAPVLSATESEAEEGWEKVPSGKKQRSGASTPQPSTSLSASASSIVPALSHPTVPGSSTAPAGPSKKQRQNAKRKEATKSSKAAEEADRLSRLASHKRAQEIVRIEEQAKERKEKQAGVSAPRASGGEWETVARKKGHAGGGGAGNKELSGGMTASVNEDG